MLIPFDKIVAGIAAAGTPPITGVLHVGAHHGEEADDYDQHAGTPPVVWVEADPRSVPALIGHVGHRDNHTVIAGAVLDRACVTRLNLANNGESSSVLELGTHADEHPDVTYVDEVLVVATTIEAVLGAVPEPGLLNFWNIDIQGAELSAIAGAGHRLEEADYLYLEVNKKELYRGCALIFDLDVRLASVGFERGPTVMTRHGWGDALYTRKGNQ